MTSSKFLAYRVTRMMCICDESPRNPPLRLQWEWGGAGVSNDWCIIGQLTCIILLMLCTLKGFVLSLIKREIPLFCWQQFSFVIKLLIQEMLLPLKYFIQLMCHILHVFIKYLHTYIHTYILLLMLPKKVPIIYNTRTEKIKKRITKVELDT